jgi:hypothetical protein
VQAKVLLDVLLTPQNLDRLTDIKVESIRSAARSLPCRRPVTSAASVVSGEPDDGQDALDEAVPTPSQRRFDFAPKAPV